MADRFVKMTKDGETILVSPLVVADHRRLGWQVAAEVKEPSDEEPKAEAKPKKQEPKAK